MIEEYVESPTSDLVDKLKKNGEKYPVEKSKENEKKYNEL